MFKKAKPIWCVGKNRVLNLQVGYRCEFRADKTKSYILKITGSTLYKVRINGDFLHYGPARAGHGNMRVDTVVIPVRNGRNILTVEVAGYNCASHYTLNVPSFLNAEILCDNCVIAYTGSDFKAVVLDDIRERKAFRHSLQRAFIECYNLDNADKLTNWNKADELIYSETEEVEVDAEYIDRRIPAPNFDVVDTSGVYQVGTLGYKEVDDIVYAARYINSAIIGFSCYKYSELSTNVLNEFYCDFIPDTRKKRENCGIRADLKANEYVIYSFGKMETGFIQCDIYAHEDSEVYIFFSDKTIDGAVKYIDYQRMNVVKYKLAKNERLYELENFEAYTMQYVGIAVVKGNISVERTGIREYCYPLIDNVAFDCNDIILKKIFDAGVNTYRQCTVDVYINNPLLERAGWLYHSYYMAELGGMLSGNFDFEEEFLNNFADSVGFPTIPKGAIAMCYPSDNPAKEYILPFSMWYVIQLERFLAKSGKIPERYKKICFNLCEYLEKFENEDGLLEHIDGWTYIESTKANDYMQDVNYPANMLYKRVCEITGMLCKDEEKIKKAERIKEIIIEQAFDGKYFRDNAIRIDGKLHVMDNYSEICQYYAVLFGVLPPSEKSFLSSVVKLRNDKYEPKSLSFTFDFLDYYYGSVLRMEILLRLGYYDKVLEEIKNCFGEMPDKTGVLSVGLNASNDYICGYMSYVSAVILRALTGIKDNADDLNEKYCKLYDYSVVFGDIRIECVDGKRSKVK